jgi:hypothetical protein
VRTNNQIDSFHSQKIRGQFNERGGINYYLGSRLVKLYYLIRFPVKLGTVFEHFIEFSL